MSDSIDPNRLAGLQGIADARDAFDAASVRADAATFDWFAADDAGLRLPITLAGGGLDARLGGELGPLADEILIPLAR